MPQPGGADESLMCPCGRCGNTAKRSAGFEANLKALRIRQNAVQPYFVINLAKREELAEALRGKLWPASVEALLLPKRAGGSRSGGIC
jgi:hypothetical protein